MKKALILKFFLFILLIGSLPTLGNITSISLESTEELTNATTTQPESSGLVPQQYFWADMPYQYEFWIGAECWVNWTTYFAGVTPNLWILNFADNGTQLLNGTLTNATTTNINIAPYFTEAGLYYLTMVFQLQEGNRYHSITVLVKDTPPPPYLELSDFPLLSEILLGQSSWREFIPNYNGYTSNGWELYVNESGAPVLSGSYSNGVPIHFEVGQFMTTPGEYEFIMIFSTNEDTDFGFYFYYTVLAEEIESKFDITADSELEFHLGQVQIIEWTPVYSNYTAWRYELSETTTQTMIDIGGYVNEGFIQKNITDMFDNIGNYTFKITFFTREGATFSSYTNVSVLDYLENDEIPPQLYVSPYSYGFYDYESVFIELQASDNFGIDSFEMLDNPYFEMSKTGVITNHTNVPVGEYELNVTVFDIAGNLNSSIVRVKILDTTAPEWDAAATHFTIVENSPMDITLTITDNYGIASITTNASEYLFIDTNGHITNTSIWSVGQFGVEFTAEDFEGNSATFSFTVSVIEETNDPTTDDDTDDTDDSGKTDNPENPFNVPGYSLPILGASLISVFALLVRKHRQ